MSLEVIFIVTLDRIIAGEVWVGIGKADFPMNRGSFKYKEKIYMKRRLHVISCGEQGNTTILNVEDTSHTITGEIVIKQEEERFLWRIELNNKEINRLWINFKTDEDERIYGCGECFSQFNLKGEKVRIWVAEHQNAKRITEKIVKEKLRGKRPDKKLPFPQYESYYAQPTFVSSKKYMVHIDTNSYVAFDFRKLDTHTLYIRDLSPIWFINGNSFEEISQKSSQFLGRQKRLPPWIYDGVVLGMQGGTQVVEQKLKLAKDKGVEVAAVWCQDWQGCRITSFGYQLMWNWQWDKKLYPDLPRKISKWKEEGIRFMGYINPFLAVEKELYEYASKEGYCVKDKEGKDYLVKITTFPAAMVDLTNPKAYEWIKGIIKDNMIALGLSGWMADFGEYLPTDCVLASGEDPQVIHNRWPALWAKINREAIEETNNLEEVFFFTRAGSTETIKYSMMMWNGDQHVDWSIDDGLSSVIPATLSLAMSGYGITHSDAGGYTTVSHMRRSKELLMRWEELCCFSPLFRTHEGNRPKDNVQYDDDDELLTHLALFSKIHKNLGAYLKACVKRQEEEGIPVMRPIFYHYDEEWAYDETYAYLLGRDILVAPVLKERQIEKSVYLPQDEWIHLFTKKEYSGGLAIVEAPLGKPPVFIRKNSEVGRKISLI